MTILATIAVAALVAFVAMQISSFSTTIYLHRGLTHRSLKLHPVVAALMRLELWLFTGLVPREWVAVHRKHHHFADEEGDPHSPHLKGLWRVLLWNAVYYAREAKTPGIIAKYTRDIPPSRLDAVLGKGWVGLGLGLSMFMYGFSQLTHGWAGPVIGAVTFVTQGLAYVAMSGVINGACHAVGYKNFSNTATNIRLVAWLAAGEGLHNNHHQYPFASKFSMRKREFDPAWPLIRFLTLLSLAKPFKIQSENPGSLS